MPNFKALEAKIKDKNLCIWEECFNLEERKELLNNSNFDDIFLKLGEGIKQRISNEIEIWNFINMNLNIKEIYYILGLADNFSIFQ